MGHVENHEINRARREALQGQRHIAPKPAIGKTYGQSRSGPAEDLGRQMAEQAATISQLRGENSNLQKQKDEAVAKYNELLARYAGETVPAPATLTVPAGVVAYVPAAKGVPDLEAFDREP